MRVLSISCWEHKSVLSWENSCCSTEWQVCWINPQGPIKTLWFPPTQVTAFCLLIAAPISDQDKSVLGSSVLRRKLCNRKKYLVNNKIILLSVSSRSDSGYSFPWPADEPHLLASLVIGSLSQGKDGSNIRYQTGRTAPVLLWKSGFGTTHLGLKRGRKNSSA